MASRLLTDRRVFDAQEGGVLRRGWSIAESALASRDSLAILEKYERGGDSAMKADLLDFLRSFHG